MSVLTLCDKTANIYSTTTTTDIHGTILPVNTLKYTNEACKLYEKKARESIAGGREGVTSTLFYRFYFTKRELDITETDFIVCDESRYDIVYVNKLYKKWHQIQIDATYSADQSIV